MDLLKQRENEGIAIFRAFAERTLKQHAQQIKDHQDAVLSGFSDSVWNGVQIQSSDVSIDMKLPKALRFIDMKTRFKKSTNETIQKKHYDVYNRIIMGNYHGILMDLTYGMTEAVVAEMKKNFRLK
ncbi:hypothetical protein [Chryseobacterium sp. FH1]|uniref:hypothetical protein n=1 Tax=Chryseobacterium sp. FH1 TaxID=1233951 RepID=UPI0004E45636|nr:hypothetical protein [Chryseobacterium sp. FH1]KFC19374.1 hypothetical protein IO90_08710 [Chryseobacterium sp. FH1]